MAERQRNAERCGWASVPVLILPVLLLFAPAASAHALRVFAFADGPRIEGTAYFAGGGAAPGARIVVKDTDGNTLARFTPAGDGSFSYRARAMSDHVIEARTGDGHLARWTVTASELAGGFPDVGRPDAGDESRSGAAGTSGVGRSETEQRARFDPALEAAIERAVARQVRPVREELAAARDAFRLKDILGGVGYLFGLAGLALWWRSRRKGRTG